MNTIASHVIGPRRKLLRIVRFLTMISARVAGTSSRSEARLQKEKKACWSTQLAKEMTREF
jgi:hypothetical protein